LQLLIQGDADFYISVELEKQLQTKIIELLRLKDGRMEEYYTKNELTPVWVVGRVYIEKGSFIE
jgi:hypothetical protein